MSKSNVIIKDNCSTHHSKAVRACRKKLGLEVLYLPADSPELKPIEKAWSLVKRRLERKKARTIPDYVDGLLEACISIDSNKCQGFYRHAAEFGYFY